MPRKLNQVIAIEKPIKAQANKAVTDMYHLFQKVGLFTGLSRTYEPLTEDGQKVPPEATLVQQNVPTLLRGVARELTKLFDTTATKEWANTKALADVTLPNGTKVLEQVPVTYLLFLEKQLVDIKTIISKLPTLDPSDPWIQNPLVQNVWVTPATQNLRTQKVLQNHVKAAATDKHPAQVETFTQDVPVGTWTTVKSSGAIPTSEVQSMLERVEELSLAVKSAREEANSIVATDRQVGAAVLNYIIG